MTLTRAKRSTTSREVPGLGILDYFVGGIILVLNVDSSVCRDGKLHNHQCSMFAHLQSEVHCVQKSIPDIFDCDMKTSYQILIIFGTNISDTICHQMTIQFSTSPCVYFCTI